MMIRKGWWEGAGVVVCVEFASEGLDSFTFRWSSDRGCVFVFLHEVVDSARDVVVGCKRMWGVLPQIVDKFV